MARLAVQGAEEYFEAAMKMPIRQKWKRLEGATQWAVTDPG